MNIFKTFEIEKVSNDFSFSFLFFILFFWKCGDFSLIAEHSSLDIWPLNNDYNSDKL